MIQRRSFVVYTASSAAVAAGVESNLGSKTKFPLPDHTQEEHNALLVTAGDRRTWRNGHGIV